MAEAVQMMREGCVGVAYRNETNRIVSHMVYPEINLCDVGNRLVCRRANIDGHRTKTIEYVVTAFDGERVTLDPRCASYDVVTLSKKLVERHFVLPCMATGHSLQGQSRPGIVIFELDYYHAYPRWMLVSATRSRDLPRVLIYDGPIPRAKPNSATCVRLCGTIATWTWGRFDERWRRLMMPSLYWKMMMILWMWKVDPENVVVKWQLKRKQVGIRRYLERDSGNDWIEYRYRGADGRLFSLGYKTFRQGSPSGYGRLPGRGHGQRAPGDASGTVFETRVRGSGRVGALYSAQDDGAKCFGSTTGAGRGKQLLNAKPTCGTIDQLDIPVKEDHAFVVQYRKMMAFAVQHLVVDADVDAMSHKDRPQCPE